MGSTELQASLLRLLRQARQAELTWMDTLSEAERKVDGTLEQWSAKDLLAHITAWKERGAENLARAQRGETRSQPNSIEELNEEIFTTSQDRSWQDVRDQAERAFTALVAQVEQHPEKAFANQEDIVWQTMACGGKHPYRHIAEFSLQQGNVEQATSLYEELIEGMRHMPLPPQELGRARYQFACFYATTGQIAKAIEELSQAQQLEPRAVEWLKQDNTLDALRSLPAFQALYPISPWEKDAWASRQGGHDLFKWHEAPAYAGEQNERDHILEPSARG